MLRREPLEISLRLNHRSIPSTPELLAGPIGPWVRTNAVGLSVAFGLFTLVGGAVGGAVEGVSGTPPCHTRCDGTLSGPPDPLSSSPDLAQAGRDMASAWSYDRSMS